MAEELAPDYYYTNFKNLIDFVYAHYRQLLSSDELAFYDEWYALSKDARQLLIRLLSRKGRLFRVDKLQYAELEDISVALKELLDRDMIIELEPSFWDSTFTARSQQEEFEAIANIFTKKELIDALFLLVDQTENGALKGLSSLRKDDLLAIILRQKKAIKLAAILSQRSTVIRLNCQEPFEVFRLCFFGNLYQSLTDFVLRDLGVHQYESYDLEGLNRAFQTRAEIESQYHYYRVSEEYETCDKTNGESLIAIEQKLPEHCGRDKALTRRVERLRKTIARQLERITWLNESDAIWASCQTHPARERRARIAASQGRVSDALGLCKDIQNNPWSEAEQEFAQSFAYRLAKKQGGDAAKLWQKPAVYQPPEVRLELPKADCSVERLVADYYAAQGACFYVENSLLNAMLGLFIWDIVFSTASGAFFNPFQGAPSDFREGYFYANRKVELDERLLELELGVYKQRILDTWQAKQGLMNPLVNWYVITDEILTLALERIPTDALAGIFKRILSDVSINRSGLPDLVLFPEGGGVSFIEVKGPGDALQNKQLLWLRYFDQLNVDHCVAYVRYQDE